MIVGGGDLSLRSEPGGGYRLQLVIGGKKEVFQLTRREERAGMWVAGEEGELRGVSQGVSSHCLSLPATAMTRQFPCTRTLAREPPCSSTPAPPPVVWLYEVSWELAAPSNRWQTGRRRA